jgi:hypothetical protein
MGGGEGGEMFTQDAEYLKSRLWRNQYKTCNYCSASDIVVGDGTVCAVI